MIAPLLFCLAIVQTPAVPTQSAQESETLEFRTWNGQHWRLKANEPGKLFIQHMPDQKKVTEEKTVDSFDYKTGGGAKYHAFIEERPEKGGKSFVIHHISENGKDNHLDTHISFTGWDNIAHVGTIINKDGHIWWSITGGTKADSNSVPTVVVVPTKKVTTRNRPVAPSSEVKPTTPPEKTKTGG